MTKLQQNLFDLSHDVKLTLDMGNLVPILALECLPGDKHTVSCESLLRFAPMTFPVMHRYDVTMHYFFVPNRILWPNWENFITNTPDETTGLLPAPPYVSMRYDNVNHQIGSLPDYLGIPYNYDPTSYLTGENVSALPFAAYQCIYNEYYRDQNLIPKVDYKLTDGDNNSNQTELFTLRRRAWEHDYFSACLPFAQKGQAVDIPLGEVTAHPPTPGSFINGNPRWRDLTTGNDITNGTVQADTDLLGAYVNIPIGGAPEKAFYDPGATMSVTPTTINDLRRAFKLQEWLEKAARGGSRYIEWIRAMFGVTSSDARLQRPEYITGTKTPVVISEVLNTTGTDNAPQGAFSGHGVSVANGNYDSYYCEEHGFIIGIMSVMPKPAYMQGLDRMWSRLQDPTQYYFSSFANIGEQGVENKEIFAYTAQGTDTFGYIPRYAEYRYQPNRVCSNFRTDLMDFHQARLFENPPALNDEFIECNPDKRIFSVTDPGVNSLYAQVYNKISSVRSIPKYGTPTF